MTDFEQVKRKMAQRKAQDGFLQLEAAFLEALMKCGGKPGYMKSAATWN